MGMTMRVSLPGYDALTDGTIDHYSVYADSDNVLIKEYMRGGTTFSSSFAVINHNLGYVPFFLAYVNDAGGYEGSPGWKQVGWANLSVAYLAWATDTTLTLANGVGTDVEFKYYIFYDQQK